MLTLHGSRQYILADTCEQKSGPSDSINWWEFLHWVCCLGENKNLVDGSRGDLKPEMAVLTRASNNLTDRPTDWKSDSQLLKKDSVSRRYS
jgi:hypothetical protein